MFKIFYILGAISVAKASSLSCTPFYDLTDFKDAAATSPAKCSDITYCVCVTGKFNNKVFSAFDCEDTVSIIVAQATNHSRDFRFSCQESASSHYSSGDYSYDYGCIDQDLRNNCTFHYLQTGSKQILMQNGISGNSLRFSISIFIVISFFLTF